MGFCVGNLVKVSGLNRIYGLGLRISDLGLRV